MHRTPHSIRHDDKHQGPHWSRWALTALAAAAITACGGGSSEPPPPVNQVPTVAMAAPANNFKANAPAAVLLTATASDSDGTIAKVEFYKVNPAAPVFDATTLVGQANAVGTPPTYQLTTAPLAAGTYNFVARATDNSGATTNSVAVQVVMNASPAVAITAPTAGASIVPGTNFTLRATATDADGSVSKVEFFLNGSATALAGTVTKNGNEYSLPWTAVTGNVSLTARATDNDGAQTTTASVAANVPPNQLPSVTLDNPTAGATAPTVLNLAASSTDGDGTVTGVEFFNGTTKLGNGTFDAASSKWKLAYNVTGTAAVSFSVIARATDNLGGQTSTASKPVSIAANGVPSVSITSPAAVTLDAGNAPKALVLTATASDPENKGIAKVEFFNGATKLGEDTTAPYTHDWASVASGSYTITAKATDSDGITQTSAAQTLVVTPNLLGPWASLTDTQKAGITLIPDKEIGDPGTDAGQVLTAVGTNRSPPAFVVAMAQALRDMADLPINLASTNPVNCGGPSDGTVTAFPMGGSDYAIKLNNCKTSTGFTLFGGEALEVLQSFTSTSPDNVCPPGNVVTPLVVGPPLVPGVCKWPTEVKYTTLGANQFRIFVNTATVTGNGAPEAGGEPFPRNAYSYSYIECTGTGAAKKCVTNLYNSFVWGNDLAWTDYNTNGTGPGEDLTLGGNYLIDDRYKLNGTIRPCQADPQPENNTIDYCKTQPPQPPVVDLRYHRHFKFENFTNIGGRAVVYGNNGWSEVKRLPPAAVPPALIGTELLTVQRTTTSPSTTDAAPKTYECRVDGLTGFWACVLKP